MNQSQWQQRDNLIRSRRQLHASGLHIIIPPEPTPQRHAAWAWWYAFVLAVVAAESGYIAAMWVGGGM